MSNNTYIVIKPEPQRGKSEVAARRLKDHPEFEVRVVDGNEVKYFRNRHLIGHDTPINGGVYVGAGDREAIVVDDSEQLKLNEVYDLFCAKSKGDWNAFRGSGFLTRLFHFTREIIPPNEEESDFLLKKLGVFKNDEEVPLQAFFGVGGVCRHIPLLNGYILERLIKEDKLAGSVSIDRNFIPGRGGHAWIRYTTFRERKVVIMDSTINNGAGFIGYLSDLKAMENPPWDYLRLTDK